MDEMLVEQNGENLIMRRILSVLLETNQAHLSRVIGLCTAAV